MRDQTDQVLRKAFFSKKNYGEAEKILHKAIKLGLDFKVSDNVVNYRDYDFLKDLILEPIPNEPKEIEKVLAEFKNKILKYSTNFSSKHFLAFPDAGNAVSSVTGALLLNLLNQNLINSKHCAPTATFVEIAVIQWLRQLVGYDVIKSPNDIFDVGGIVVSGGVMANTVGLMLAREHCFPGTKNSGINFDPSKVKVIIPDFVNHYSIRAGLGWIGLGEENLITIKSDNFRMDLGDLRQKVRDYSQDNRIMAAVAYAGDSRSMTIDNFKAVHEIIKSNNIWFHIDACHGFQYAFSEKLRDKIAGIELADSITTDPHKVLFTPYTMSVVMAKDPQAFKTISGYSDLITKEDFAFGQITPMLGSRNFSSLKLWFLLKTLGSKAIGRLIEERHALAAYLGKKLQHDPNFIVLNQEVNINSVVFMFVPDGWKSKAIGNKKMINQLNELNTKVQDAVFRQGKFYVHTFSIPDLADVLQCGQIMLHPLRYMGGNPLTKERDIDQLIKHIKKTGREEAKAIGYIK